MFIRSSIVTFVCLMSLYFSNAIQAKNNSLSPSYLEFSEDQDQPNKNFSWPNDIGEVKLPKETQLSSWLPAGPLKIVPAKKGGLSGVLVFNSEAYNDFTKANSASNIQILFGLGSAAKDQQPQDTYLTLIGRSGIFSPSIHAVWVELNKLVPTYSYSKATIVLFN